VKKNKAIKILSDSGNLNVVEVNMSPGQYLEKHSHDWDVDIIILEGTLQINTNNKARLLTAGDRFKLKSNVGHTEYAGIEGVSFLSARPSK